MKKRATRIEWVINDIEARIAARTCLPGQRLPSVRSQARYLGVSVSTVVEAYERLAAAGTLVSRPGSGFYVTGHVAPLTLKALGPQLDREVDPLWISRQSLESDEQFLKPGCGWLPADWLFESGMRRALRALSHAKTLALTEYATPQGHLGLRQWITRRLQSLGIEAGLEQVMLTESGTHAIDLICRFLLEPGDTVLVDDPCYFNFHALLKAHRVKVVGIPYTPTGPDTGCFSQALQQHAPRLYITNSGLHNPTGAVLSPAVAHRILSLSQDTGLVIVEDDIFAEFEQTPAARLAAFDGLQRVIQIGSFSKTVSASLRCGYIVTQPNWIESLNDLKIATTMGGGRLAAEAIFRAITDSGYRKHMEKIRQRLAVSMAECQERLEAMGIVPWFRPSAGMFIWCQLPEGYEAAAIARYCLAKGVILAPGNVFSQASNAGGFLRFNVAQSLDERVYLVLADAFAEQS